LLNPEYTPFTKMWLVSLSSIENFFRMSETRSIPSVLISTLVGLFGDEKVGFILDSKISDDDGTICEISKEKGELLDPEGEVLLSLEGNYETLELMDYFGIAGTYLKSRWSEKVFRS